MDRFDAAMAELMDCLKAQRAEIAALRVGLTAVVLAHRQPDLLLQVLETLSLGEEASLLSDTTSSDVHVDDQLRALQLLRDHLANAVGAHSKPRSDPSTP